MERAEWDELFATLGRTRDVVSGWPREEPSPAASRCEQSRHRTLAHLRACQEQWMEAVGGLHNARSGERDGPPPMEEVRPEWLRGVALGGSPGAVLRGPRTVVALARNGRLEPVGEDESEGVLRRRPDRAACSPRGVSHRFGRSLRIMAASCCVVSFFLCFCSLPPVAAGATPARRRFATRPRRTSPAIRRSASRRWISGSKASRVRFAIRR